MKSALGILIIVFAALGCKKDNKFPKAEASTLSNGENWEVEKVWAFPSDIGENTLDFNLSFNKFGYSSALLFYNVSRSLGKQALKKKDYNNLGSIHGLFINSQENDVTGDVYDVLVSDSTNNWIEITDSKDNFTKDIHGVFSLTLVRTKKFLNSPFPDTLRFTAGTFFISKLKD